MDKYYVIFAHLQAVCLIETYDETSILDDYNYLGLNNLDEILEERRYTRCQLPLVQGW